MDGSVGEQIIVVGGSSGFEHVGGERIGNRHVLDLRSGRGEIWYFDTMLVDRRFQRQAHAISAVLADRAEQSGHHTRDC